MRLREEATIVRSVIRGDVAEVEVDPKKIEEGALKRIMTSKRLIEPPMKEHFTKPFP
jgi:hypothetical protein